MSNTKISKRYAKALFDFAKENNNADTIKEDMNYVFELCNISSDFNNMLNSPLIKSSKKIEILEAILKNNVSDISMKFLNLMTKAGRESFIGGVAEQYIIMHDELIGVKKVEVYSAQLLSNEIKTRIKTTLESQTKKNIELEEKVNEDLIGGFIIKIDDKQFDASIRTMLNKIKHELKN